MKYIQPDWPAPANIKAITTLKTCWGDPQASTKDPIVRQQLTDLYTLPNDPLWLNQTHSTIAVKAISQNKDADADATFTDESNQICIVLTADCLPILICHEDGKAVAAIHAGWRGLANGIIESTLQAMRQPAEKLLVWLGPAIGPQKFEVGIDVYEAFTQAHPEAELAFKSHTKNKWLADLYALAKMRLQKQGINKIYGGTYCTYTQSELFYSYRREQQNSGRMASLIWISDSSHSK
ncbi:MAG: hypothetical protein ACD_46C00028G0003 [uncultured bacterium]|nr:MAG: hypothetical protein ACD_46C00028G0003 [uncultured bacterium]